MHLHRYSGEFAGNAMHGVGVFETANGVTYWGGYSAGMKKRANGVTYWAGADTQRV